MFNNWISSAVATATAALTSLHTVRKDDKHFALLFHSLQRMKCLLRSPQLRLWCGLAWGPHRMVASPDNGVNLDWLGCAGVTGKFMMMWLCVCVTFFVLFACVSRIGPSRWVSMSLIEVINLKGFFMSYVVSLKCVSSLHTERKWPGG